MKLAPAYLSHSGRSVTKRSVAASVLVLVGLGIVESGGLGRDKGKWASTTLLLLPGKIRYEEVIPRGDPTSFAQSVTGGIARGNRLD